MEVICKASGTQIMSRIIQTPAGKYEVKVCREGAHSIHRAETTGWSGSVQDINVLKSNPPLTLTGDAKDSNATMNRLVEWFHLYFADLAGLEKAFSRPFQFCTPDATELQKTIWKALQENVGFGSTITYGGLAKIVERPKAARAVGSAMSKNPNCLVVPCHRVIKANSDLGNYSSTGGVELKRWLLEHEMGNAKSARVKNNGAAA